MKQKWTRIVWVALVLALLASLTVSAKGGQDTPGTGEVMEISWLGKYKTEEETSWASDFIEEKFNVKITWNGIHKGDKEKLAMMVAAGETPDVGNLMYVGGPLNMYLEGVIRGIPEKLIRKNAPNYAERTDNEFPLGWLINKNPDKEGEYLAITSYYLPGATNFQSPAFRVDWAEKVGFELPNYEQNKRPLDRFGKVYHLDEDFTMDWLERLLVAFRDGDPDGNGKNDTIPFGAYSDRTQSWNTIMGAFGITDYTNYNKAYGTGTVIDNGELYVWSIAPGYKEFLKLASRWYSNGLVDKEFVTLNRAKRNEKVAGGVTALVDSFMIYAGGMAYANRPPNVFATDEDVANGVEVVIIPPVIGPTGMQGGRMQLPGYLFNEDVSINKNVDDAKAARILQIIDYLHFGEHEGWVYGKNGKPGVHFDWEGEPFASKPIARNVNDIPEGYPKMGPFPASHPGCYARDHLSLLYPEYLYKFFDEYMMGERGQKLSLMPVRFDIFNEGNIIELQNKYAAVLNTMVDEFYFGAITGQIDIDAEWDGYVTEWKKNGGSEILESLKNVPLISELNKGKIVY